MHGLEIATHGHTHIHVYKADLIMQNNILRINMHIYMNICTYAHSTIQYTYVRMCININTYVHAYA